MIRTNPGPNGRPVTTKLIYADYLKTSADERYELLDGELIIMPAPSITHQHVAMKLGGHPRFGVVQISGLRIPV